MAAEDDRQRRAKNIAEARYAFRWHLPIYLIVNSVLVGIWYYSRDGFPWPLFPIVFWGFGVVSHYIGAYRVQPGADWIDRETQKILKEEMGRR